MKIHTRGLNHDEIMSSHIVFLPEIWRTILWCFTDMEAMQLDCIYGAPQANWIIQERIPSIPSTQTWLVAALHRSMGMMIYLLKYHIACPQIEDIIQFAADKNHMDTLVFFTSECFKFCDNEGLPLKKRFCPSLDKAAKRNHLQVIRYVKWRFPQDTAHMIKRPLVTLSYVMERNLLDVLKELVPDVTLITAFTGLKMAIIRGHRTIVKYALQHLNDLYVGTELPDDLLVAAAKNGHLRILKLLKKRRKNGNIPLKAFQQAFSWGHVDVCNYIKKCFPSYLPTQKDLIDASLHGHHEVLSMVPDTMHIPSDCMENAAKSQNHILIYVLTQKNPHYKYQPRLLSMAIRSGNSDVCLAVFDCGKYTKLPVDSEIEMVNRRMRKALNIFHNLGFNVYTEDALLEASRICDLPIIQDIISSGLKPSVKVVRECLNYIYVSSESTKCRMEAFTYLDNQCRGTEPRALSEASNSQVDVRELECLRQTRKRHHAESITVDLPQGTVDTSDYQRSVGDAMTRAKRFQYVHH